MKQYGLYIDGKWRQDGKMLSLKDKYSGMVFAEIKTAEFEDIEAALVAASKAARNPLPFYRRYEILHKAQELLLTRKDDLAHLLTREVGKPIRESRAEVERAALTLEWAAEEAKRITGHTVPVEAAPGAQDYMAFTMRVPVGVVCAITPFNAPLNLTCHKIGPALAAGNSVILKPASTTPGIAAELCQIFEASGLPKGYLNLLVGSGEVVGERLLEDERINCYSFTGSPSVGLNIRQKVGLRKAILELGSNSAVIIEQSADLKRAAKECVRQGVANAGQVCISVQRVFVQETIFSEVLALMSEEAAQLVVGNPLEEHTDVGPMISLHEAERAEAWLKEAVAEGAKVVFGGTRKDRMFMPTILSRTSPQMKVRCSEVFAPIISVEPYQTFSEALELVNDSSFGLQAGVFTHDINQAFEATRVLQVGGVIVNATSAFRVDHMPYGGIKLSGNSKEGPHYAIEEMTEEKLIVIRREEV